MSYDWERPNYFHPLNGSCRSNLTAEQVKDMLDRAVVKMGPFPTFWGRLEKIKEGNHV